MRVPGLLALPGLLLAVCIAMLWGIRAFSGSADRVGRTHEVLAEIEAVRSAVREVESAARGFRLTGQPGLEAEYLSQKPGVAGHLARLAGMVADNPVQVRQLARLRTLVDARIEEVEVNIGLFRSGESNAAIDEMRNGRGVHLMGRVDAVANEMREAEEHLLTDRRIATGRQAVLITMFVISGTLMSILMLGVLLAYLGRENRRARTPEREARASLAALEASMQQRERPGEQRRILGAFAGLLHACQDVAEALDVAGNALGQLVPQGARLAYLRRASQNLLEMRARFGAPGTGFGDVMRPDQCWGLRRGQAHASDPDRPTARCEHLREVPDDRAYAICVPLSAHGVTLGLLHLRKHGGEPLHEVEVSGVETVAEHLAVALHSLDLRESLRSQSRRDPLTGLYNRRYLEESLPREIERCERRGRPCPYSCRTSTISSGSTTSTAMAPGMRCSRASAKYLRQSAGRRTSPAASVARISPS
jgi:CHASE3 domain sensor protein